eukprot:TRINITY_DN538_c0_g2_i1.p1 TRINITY_DN538_c0_g2~~TRINITY_DN538_c0_g2_i1.p1  ORF type:complete len:449 (-),score=62.75 TRINITY_DN538_c0_g2_i1:85-1431(-)
MTGAECFLGIQIEEDEEMEEFPTELSTKALWRFLHVSTDKLTVQYSGSGNHGNDVGAVQANHPVPTQRLLYYFEITVKDRGERGEVVLGFTDPNFKTTRQPGWEVNSYGYHGVDGKVYRGKGTQEDPFGELYGPTFTTGDVVGAGINHATQEIFFTKNGKLLGTAFREVKGVLYPTIGLHSPDEKVEVNFGQSPFVFDIEVMAREERERRYRGVETIALSSSVSHSIVRAYLQHYAYGDTLQKFDEASAGIQASLHFPAEQNGNGPALDHGIGSLEQRKLLRQVIREGDVDTALEKLREWYPDILHDTQNHVAFLLHCQKFIELMKKSACETAVEFSRRILSPLRGRGMDAEDLHLKNCMTLLAYESLDACPNDHLLKLPQREAVADVVNAAILAATLPPGVPPISTLETLLRQLNTCHLEKRALSGGQGEIFRLHTILAGSGKDGGW